MYQFKFVFSLNYYKVFSLAVSNMTDDHIYLLINFEFGLYQFHLLHFTEP